MPSIRTMLGRVIRAAGGVTTRKLAIETRYSEQGIGNRADSTGQPRPAEKPIQTVFREL